MPKTRQPRFLVVLVVGSLVLATASYFVGRDSTSSSQLAAKATPPTPSIPTVAARYAVLRATVAFRAEVVDATSIDVPVPHDLGSELPVLTSMPNARRSSPLARGALLFSVAEHPVFLMAGRIPAFRPIASGDSGVDVSELQRNLRALGYYAGGDTAGRYGPATQNAAEAFFLASGFPLRAPAIPLGELVFAPRTPVRVQQISAQVGAVLSPNQQDKVEVLGAGRPYLTASIPVLTAGALRSGARGRAHSIVSGQRFGVRVVSAGPGSAPSPGRASAARVRLEPIRRPTPQLLGQNVGVRITTATSGEKRMLIPIAALTTRSTGNSYVDVVAGSVEHSVQVRPGLTANGLIAVVPTGVDARYLVAGARVVVG